MELTGKEFSKFEYIVGFVNAIVDMVSDPEELLDCDTKDCSVLSIGYEVNQKDRVKISTIDGEESVSELKQTLNCIESMVRESLKTGTNYEKEWEKLRR